VQQLKDRGIEILTPILGNIISQGVEEGFFDTEYPYEAAEFLIRGAEGFISIDLGDADAVMRALVISLDTWERVLGADKGTFMGLAGKNEDLLRKIAEAADRVETSNDITDKEGDD
jgi:hypothetical protein